MLPAPDVSGASEASGGQSSFGNSRQAAKKHYCRRKELMASVRTHRKNYARARCTFPESEKPARKVGGEAAHFWCPFFEFWRGGTRSRIVFLEVFARRPLILSDDNIWILSSSALPSKDIAASFAPASRRLEPAFVWSLINLKDALALRHKRQPFPFKKRRRVYKLFFGGCFFQKMVKTAVPDNGRPPRAVVFTQLVE